MTDEVAHRFLWSWTISELVLVIALFGLLAGSLFGDGTFLASVSRDLRLAALVFLAIELLIPLWVFFDLRRRADDPESFWMHVAAMPGVNIFGFVAYLQMRQMSKEE